MLSIVIPMYNEGKVAAQTVAACHAYALTHPDTEFLLVNDGSTDNTRTAAEQAAADKPCVTVTGYEKNRGKGGAVRFGVEQARGDLILFTDADLSYGTDIFETILAKQAETDADIVIGSRHLNKEAYKSYPLLRKIASRVFSFTVNTILGLKVSDSQCGLKLFKAAAAKDLFRDGTVNGYAFDLEILALASHRGLSVAEIPAIILVHGESKVNVVSDSIKMLKDAWKVRKAIKKNK